MPRETLLTPNGLADLKGKIERLSTIRRREVAAELEWVIQRAEEHLGEDRAGHYLRKFYPWYAERLDLSKRTRLELVGAPTTTAARSALKGILDSHARAVAA